MKIISLSGAIGSGKDTVAQMIQELSNAPVYHCKFAHAIQDQTASLCGFYRTDLSHRKRFDDRSWKEEASLLSFKGVDYTPRDLLKTIGQGYRDLFGPDIWVNRLAEQVSRLPEEDAIVVISDLRFPNELDWVNDSLGWTAYIKNEAAEAAFYDENDTIDVSESYLTYLEKMVQMEILNEATLMDLFYFVRAFLTSINVSTTDTLDYMKYGTISVR